MTSSAKQKTLLIVGLVMLITVMIAASLPQSELQPGTPLPRFENNQMMVAPVEEQVFVTISVSKFILVFFPLILTGSMLYVLYRVFKGADRKFLTSFIPSMFIISLMALSVIIFITLLPKSNLSVPMDLPLPTTTPPATSPLELMPPLLLWLVGIGLLVITLLLGVWIFLSANYSLSK